MAEPHPEVDAFLGRAKRWRPELERLRAILLAAPLAETFKWHQPCYTHAGGNVAILGSYRDGAVLSFFRGALLSDPEGILVPPGPNSRASRVVRFGDVGRIEALAPVLAAYLREAAALQAEGRKVDFAAAPPLPFPAELTRALAADAGLAAAFRALTPGRQRGYLLHFAAAKQPATRAARIARQSPRILEGKGMHDR